MIPGLIFLFVLLAFVCVILVHTFTHGRRGRRWGGL